MDEETKSKLAEDGISLEFAKSRLPFFLDHKFRHPESDWQAKFRNFVRNANEWTSSDSPTETDDWREAGEKLCGPLRKDESEEAYRKRIADADTARRYGLTN